MEPPADAGPLVERLRAQYGKRLAGLYFEKYPDRLVVRLTGENPVKTQIRRIGAQRVEVVFLPGAAHTYAQLTETLEKRVARSTACCLAHMEDMSMREPAK